MSSPDLALPSERGMTGVALAVALAVVARIFVPNTFLDLFYDYDIALGGSPLLKIHPGTYLLLLVAAVLAPARIRAGGEVFIAVAAALATSTLCCMGWAVYRGMIQSIGFLIDSNIAAAAFCICAAKLEEQERQSLLGPIVIAITANAVITLGESVTRLRILPYRYEGATGELVFRPTALLNHPLVNGLFQGAAVPFVFMLRTPLFQRTAIAILLTLATFASEARVSSLAALPALAISVYLSIREANDRALDANTSRFLQSAIAVLLAPLGLLLGLIGGLGERLATGLFDRSASVRVDAFALLQHLSNAELMGGVGLGRVALLTSAHGGLVIESPIVAMIFLFGAPNMVIFFAAIAFAMLALIRGAPLLVILGVVTFFLIAMTNNGMTSKTPEMLFMTCLLAATRRRGAVAQLVIERPAIPTAVTIAERQALAKARQARIRAALAGRRP